MNSNWTAKRRRSIYLTMVILAFISSMVLLTGRIAIEKRNRTVELVIDYESLFNVCLQEQIDLFSTLDKLKTAGITSVALSEMTLQNLSLQGRVQWMTGNQLKSVLQVTNSQNDGDVRRIKSSAIYAWGFSPQLENTVTNYLEILRGKNSFKFYSIDPGSGHKVRALEIEGNPEDLPFMSLGFDRRLIDKLSDMGLMIVLRPSNQTGFSSANVKNYLKKISSIKGVSTIIFGGTNEVLGYPFNLDATVEAFKSANFSFGDIEVPNPVAKQKGAKYLALRIPHKTVRVQSINPQYLAKLTPDTAVDKFKLGVRERNIKLIYLRPYPRGIHGKNILKTNLDYVSNLKTTLKNYGFSLGAASRFPLTTPPVALVLVIIMGGVGIFMLLLDNLGLDRPYLSPLLFGGAFLVSLILIFAGRMDLVQKIGGLAIGITFPVYAFASRFDRIDKTKTANRFSTVLFTALLTFAEITLITIVGGLLIAGLFSSTTFMLAIDRFRGVKLVMLLPPALSVLLYYARGTNRQNALKKFKETLKNPLQIWHVAAAGVLLIVVMIYILRTGNEAPSLATQQERQLRMTMEQLLWVRPRIKDFLLGHPAMILTWALAKLNQLWGLGVLVFFASVGQADIIDTFSHIHTPVFISLVRVLIGSVLGIITGTIMLGVYWAGRKVWQKKKKQPGGN